MSPLKDNLSCFNLRGISYWKVYCHCITFWAPPVLLKFIGFTSKERQYAWREKIASISIILYIGFAIAFLTFGFTRTVCSDKREKINVYALTLNHLVANGKAYDLSNSSHPAALGIESGSNILYPPINAGGKDASFLFQNVNGNCRGIITPKNNCSIPHDGIDLAWYMPCKVFPVNGTKLTDFEFDHYDGYACHASEKARSALYNLKAHGDVYYTWQNIQESERNLVVYNGIVLDLGLLGWLLSDDLDYPNLFDSLVSDSRAMKGRDLSLALTDPVKRPAINCLADIIRAGSIDVSSFGCIISSIVLYTSTVLVLSIILIKFVVACYYKWVVAPKQGASVTPIKQMNLRNKKIEDWADDPLSSVALPNVPVKRRAGYNEVSKRRGRRIDWGQEATEYVGDANFHIDLEEYRPKYLTTTTEAFLVMRNFKYKRQSVPTKEPLLLDSYSNVDLTNREPIETFLSGAADDSEIPALGSMLIHPHAILKPPVNWEPYGYPLIHTMCLVTCYSEDETGIRTTLDSIATTDYPNSHKLIVIICDGLITGAGNEKPTPDICLSLLTDVTPEMDPNAHSYVSLAQGSRRHNMANTYSGFYKYDDMTVPPEQQQKIPVLLVVKCGTKFEQNFPKPGNRGKRDSQIILMSFLQKVTFNDRMTGLEFSMLKAIWRVTGLMATVYEAVLMVDADTLVYPDSVTHMVAELVKNPDVMGLCGETRISNKTESWVTAIQVFEYYISHHQSKAFESVFGTVTCLPGCFCMYRIKAPKSLNVWVPLLASPDIVEKYSENVLDSLHRKNLLLLGEDRYLSSLMLRTFPRRRQVFVSKAACKTVVPHKFNVLLSQRRRWINSTVHNLIELALVNNLCGTFCFSMRFLIIAELIGTVVLPASITFTIYILLMSMIAVPTPVMPLILMGIIFGLPGLLILVTASSLTYVLWMFIYFLSLPIWNFVLPAYAFWKFDDFSWGDTRLTESGFDKNHEQEEGEFDGSNIVHKTWRDFERERLGLGGAHMIPTVFSGGGNPINLQHNYQSFTSLNSSDVELNAPGGLTTATPTSSSYKTAPLISSKANRNS
ncbi:glycosyltransferase family 2 protein [[Candida] arabinofermentans NRRL YB-2248]|uniref:chitin synthase n=1 Tax=[Candida] arabinofermentans NRRL YB-2248 TaxID=983967 RepID=A0A1E4SVJ5_9ASCO|nr:glycosyltransferase family 2 protein [[Candida] arabinofermentans NRRL YB-2248]